MRKSFSVKAENIKPSATLQISAKASELKKNGVDIISLSIGEPDFSTPEYIIEGTKKALVERLTKYAPVAGVPSLKKVLSEKLFKENGLNYDENQIVVSTGAKSSVYHALFALLNEGDEVIIPSPYWLSYPEMVALNGGTSVCVCTKKENDYKITAKELQNAITPKTKCLILNSPNNPTGAVYSRDELEKLAKVIVKNNIFVLSDEVYEKFVFNGNRHVSIASLGKEIYDRTITVNAVSKTYAMTGYRIGYLATNEKLAKLISSVQSHTTSGANTFAQYGAITAVSEENGELDKMIAEFDKRRKILISCLSSLKGVSFVEPAGAFYVMLDVSGYYGKTFNGTKIADSFDFSRELLSEGVAVVPGKPFGSDECVRLAYTVEKSKIEEAVRRIDNFLKKII